MQTRAPACLSTYRCIITTCLLVLSNTYAPMLLYYCSVAAKLQPLEAVTKSILAGVEERKPSGTPLHKVRLQGMRSCALPAMPGQDDNMHLSSIALPCRCAFRLACRIGPLL